MIYRLTSVTLIPRAVCATRKRGKKTTMVTKLAAVTLILATTAPHVAAMTFPCGICGIDVGYSGRTSCKSGGCPIKMCQKKNRCRFKNATGKSICKNCYEANNPKPVPVVYKKYTCELVKCGRYTSGPEDQDPRQECDKCNKKCCHLPKPGTNIASSLRNRVRLLSRSSERGF